MNTLTRLAISLSLVGFTCLLPITTMGTTDSQASTKVTMQYKEKPLFLFVLRADTGEITKTNRGYTLTLDGMDNKVLYFSDRPMRKAGFITMSQFMGEWAAGKDSFKTNPPNAAIVHAALKTNAKGITQALPVELTHPTLTSNGWTFQLKDLQGRISAGSYKGIIVFVDDTTITIGGPGDTTQDEPSRKIGAAHR